MNLLENYIKEVYSVTDVTNRFTEKTGEIPKEPLLKVKLRIDCYGCVEDTVKMFFASEWEEVKKKGYYMG